MFLCLDTYGEATHAYEIAVNPYGIPGDLLFSPAYGEDIGYDMIYQSASRITDQGWVAEMAVPVLEPALSRTGGADVASRLLAQPPARVALPVLMGRL